MLLPHKLEAAVEQAGGGGLVSTANDDDGPETIQSSFEVELGNEHCGE